MANGSIIGIPKWIIEKLEEIKKSVSDGKKLVANAITAKGQATAEDATFQTMANNIGMLVKPSGTLTLSNPTNGTDCTNYASVKTSGLVKPSGTKSITSNGTVDVSAYATASVSVGSVIVVKYGTVSSTSTIQIGKTIATNKYVVLLNTKAYNTSKDNGNRDSTAYGYGDGAYISSKGTTSFTITVSTGITCDYQVLEITGNSTVLYGTKTSSGAVSLPTNSSALVILNTNAYSIVRTSLGNSDMVEWGYGKGAYVSAKSSSSCTITLSSGITCSYQIILFN